MRSPRGQSCGPLHELPAWSWGYRYWLTSPPCAEREEPRARFRCAWRGAAWLVTFVSRRRLSSGARSALRINSVPSLNEQQTRRPRLFWDWPSKQKQADAPGGRNVSGALPGESALWAPSTEIYSLPPSARAWRPPWRPHMDVLVYHPGGSVRAVWQLRTKSRVTVKTKSGLLRYIFVRNFSMTSIVRSGRRLDSSGPHVFILPS